jgi:hypothetical protein
MSSLEEVRAAERRVQELLERLTKAGAADPQNIRGQLQTATDDYRKAVRELQAK